MSYGLQQVHLNKSSNQSQLSFTAARPCHCISHPRRLNGRHSHYGPRCAKGSLEPAAPKCTRFIWIFKAVWDSYVSCTFKLPQQPANDACSSNQCMRTVVFADAQGQEGSCSTAVLAQGAVLGGRRPKSYTFQQATVWSFVLYGLQAFLLLDMYFLLSETVPLKGQCSELQTLCNYLTWRLQCVGHAAFFLAD